MFSQIYNSHAAHPVRSPPGAPRIRYSKLKAIPLAPRSDNTRTPTLVFRLP